ncbi:hypothetical protein A9Q99_20090 [Gammaproteobacteria bacterium 45_16_T64]|nr:hypothetical protein A9Q99_20090 [Gammaproteobacteria bacterium 45_16_T64]
MSRTSSRIPEKWKQEEKAAKAVQVAFDVGFEVQTVIRKEALDCMLSPSDRVRQILGLDVTSRPKRPRLSISLTQADFLVLGGLYGVDPANRVEIKQRAAENLIKYVDEQKGAC